MEAKGNRLYSILVRGDWDRQAGSKALQNKLCCYFLSQKKSGGGECLVEFCDGQIRVCFAEEEARQRVLARRVHEIDLPEKGKVRLEIQLPDATEQQKTEELKISKSEPMSTEAAAVPGEVTSAELDVSRETDSILVPFSGETVNDDVLEMYFENKKRSGGGPIKSVLRGNEGIEIIFENVNDAMEVLNRRSHTIQNAHIQVQPTRRTCTVKEKTPTVRSSSVVLQNVPDHMTLEMLTLLVENMSEDLAEDDFSVELIPELNVAVVTLKNNDGLMDFIQKCTQNNRLKQSNINARILECTKSIIAENLPPGISPDYITIYFESSKHGGGRVSETEFLSTENSAIITFYDQRVLTTVLEKTHHMEGNTISVHPYYTSLGAALYGKERPILKLPEPVKLPLNMYIWQFFQKNKQIIEYINIEMRDSNCELTWPHSASPCTEVIISPSTLLTRKKQKLLVKLVKVWHALVTEKFLSLLSKYNASEIAVNPAIWDTMKEKVNSAMEDGICIIPEVNKGKVVLVGTVEKVVTLEEQFNEILAETIKQIERKNESIEECLSVSAPVYVLLCRDKLEEAINKAFPYLEYNYDPLTSIIKLVGLPKEVFGAKSKILEDERNLKQKSIELSPQVVHFFQQVNNNELSDVLFASKNINAVYRLDANIVVLMGNSENAINRAEKEIEQGIICKFVTFEDQAVTKMKEWHELISTLKTIFNVGSTGLIISIEENQVVIVGYSEAVIAAHNQVSDFIDSNTHIVESIPFKYEVVVQFLKEEKKDIILDIQKKNINIDFIHHPKKEISLSGCGRDVRLMAEKVGQVLSSLHEKVLPIKKPGAKKYFETQDDAWFIRVKQKFNCYIRLTKDGEEYEDFTGVEAGMPSYFFKLQCGTVIGVYKDDLTKHPVDVVVNASNEDLKHIGGLALALLKAAGPKLQTECDEIVKERGKINPGEVVVTSPGNLPCKQVVHAVGPRWHDANAAVSEFLLKKVVQNSLQRAERFGHHSIGIPAISSGVFGFPLELCTDRIVLSLKEHMEDITRKSSLKEIHLVDTSLNTVEAFKHALTKHFGDRSHIHPMSNQRRSNATDQQYPGRQGDDQIVKTHEGLKIILRQGNIQDSTTAVIVNSISQDLNLAAGGVSKALLQKAGLNLQELLSEAAQNENVDVGSVLQTNGCNLNCKKVFHVIAPQWDSKRSAEALKDVIKDCLKNTERLGLNSIGFPAIGTGNLGFPKPVAANLMLGQVIKYSERKNFKNLREVHFVLHPSDKDTIKAFSDELENKFGANVTYTKYVPQQSSSFAAGVPASSKTADSTGIIGPISIPTLGVYEMQVGPFTLEVKSGDITKETSDVIVNSTNQTFNLKQGVSKAIMEAAGQAVELECAQKAALKNNGYITTTNGALLCKNIIHVVGPTHPKQIKTVVENVLQECEQRQHASVAFPAMGTGQGRADPSLVADSMIDSVIDFASQKNAQYVKKITIIIFQPQMLEQFHTCMKNKQGTKIPEQKSMISRVASALFGSKKTDAKKKMNFVLEDKIEPAIFQICGESKDNVENAAAWIEKLILEEQFDNIIKDEWISDFGEPERLRLTELQNSLQIRIKVNCQQDDSFVQVTGLTRDVMKASNEIQEMIKKINKQLSQKRHAELVSNIVQWQYEVGGTFVAFDDLANLELEKAFTENKTEAEVQCGNRKYKVNFTTETARDDLDQTVNVKRFPKAEENDIPPQWEGMSANKVNLVQMMPTTKEYQEVDTMFRRSCGLTIHKIERVQNLFLWRNYVIKKMSIDDKNGNQNNEKQLFHGTAQTFVNQINKNGFNRSFAGMNAAVIGNGTYFAVNANYSAHDTYSKPDPNTGMKYMYLTRVLTGLFCAGKQGILTPPAKNRQDPTDLYDSVTDNVANPTTFVVFNDVQAYPEYLISFK